MSWIDLLLLGMLVASAVLAAWTYRRQLPELYLFASTRKAIRVGSALVGSSTLAIMLIALRAPLWGAPAAWSVAAGSLALSVYVTRVAWATVPVTARDSAAGFARHVFAPASVTLVVILVAASLVTPS